MTTGRKPRRRSKSPDPDRWPACARCHEYYETAAHWPDGPVCMYCYTAAKRRSGTCADCGHAGMTPGVNPAGDPTCLRCSGVPISLTCAHCGEETWLAKGATCWQCLLGELIYDLLSGPDGTVQIKLQPLAAAIAAMPRAHSRIVWIRANPKVRELLTALGDGTIALTHEALDDLPRSQTVEYIRDLLVVHHALPPRDRLLATYEQWLTTKLDTITDDEQRTVIERFGRWHHLRALRRQAQDRPVESGPFLRAKQSTTVAVQFLAWLAERGRTLGDCTQHDIDAWYGGGPGTRRLVDRFLYWSRANRLTDKLEIPGHKRDERHLIGEQERLRIIRHLLVDDGIPDVYRVAGCLLTVFGQPVSRIVTMTIDNIRIDGDSVQVCPAQDWLDVPAPLAVVVKRHLDNRKIASTTANAHTRWLFPGHMPGQHIRCASMSSALRNHGIPSLATRNTTWQQLVRHAPPQVVARALGISPQTAMDYAERAGADWMRYTADRSRNRQ